MKFDQTDLLEYFDEPIPQGDMSYGEFAFRLTRGSDALTLELHALGDSADVQIERASCVSTLCMNALLEISVNQNVATFTFKNGVLEIRKGTSGIGLTMLVN